MSSANSLILLQFVFATLLPVFLSIVFTLLDQRTAFGKLKYWPKQVIIGLAFGAVAIFGTEAGIATGDATMNVRDAAPIVAGLYFGGPAGIIAGLVGGIERWFAALWGRGMFTRLACSVATIFAGLYASALRRHLFDKRRPSWLLGLAIGLVAEVLHLLLVFVTNFDDSVRAFRVVQACTFPMITCNALSVALSSVALALLAGQPLMTKKESRDISQRVQLGMLGVVVVGFATTLGFVFLLQSSIAATDVRMTLELALDDTIEDISDASDNNLLLRANRAAEAIPSVQGVSQKTIDTLVDELNLAELHVIGENGKIVASSDEKYVGFDMASGEQSAEFLKLLPGGGSTQLVQSYQPITMDNNVWRKYAGVSIDKGFVQVGYDAMRFIDDLTDQVRLAVANRHVGREGLLVVLSERGDLVGARDDSGISYQTAKKLDGALIGEENRVVFEVPFHGQSYLAMFQKAEGFKIIAMLPRTEADMERDLSVLVTSFMEVIAFAALFVAIYVLIKRVVVRSIWQVNGRLGQITNGNLEVQVDVRDSAEFALLSDDINGTVKALREAIAAESARIERDLATAKAIQESALPSTFPPFPDINAFDIYASMNAARVVGGDFYDFFLVDDHTLCFLIADVSGKGIPASLFMMAAKSELANYIRSGMELAEAVHSANWDLCQGNDAGMFVTVWAATLDFETGRLNYVNAGHNPPLLRHKGKWEWLKKKGGLFLGTFEMAKYRSDSLTLVPGDEILLYTDGVNEAFSVTEEEYGNDRLEAFLNAHANLHPRMMVEVLRADVHRWAKGAEQSDDITMLCLEYGCPPEVTGTIRVPATKRGLDEVRRKMHYELSQLQCPETTQRQLDLTIEELFTNVFEHGYVGMETPGDVEISYVYDSDPSAITVSITDWGVPFDPLGYDVSEIDVKNRAKGAGIVLALANVDDVAYVRDDDRNITAFRKTW